VVGISESLVSYAGLIFGTLAVVIVVAITSFRKQSTRRRIHAAILRLPFFGPLARKLATAQVARTLATLLGGGIPLVNALDISAKAVNNLAIADGLAAGRAAGPGRREPGAHAHRAKNLSERGRWKWSRSASRQARSPTC
jgi:type IV pilus assembly protein PilC